MNIGDTEFLEKTCRVEPDRPDSRDYSLLDVSGVMIGPGYKLPESKEIPATELPDVGNQQDTGSCVGWASAWGLRHWLHQKESGTKQNFSVRFVWMAAKEVDPFPLNVIFPQSGTRIRDAMKIMQKYGVPEDTLYPFERELPVSNNRMAIIQNALKYRIGLYFSLKNTDEMRWNIANVGPFVIGVPVHANFSRLVNGVVQEPEGQRLGGHALLICGYNDSSKTFKAMNSWGPTWGENGFCRFTYDWIKAHYWDAWAVAPRE
jgi:C1A family cysteine protease